MTLEGELRRQVAPHVSLIGIEDSAGVFSSTTWDGVLTEVDRGNVSGDELSDLITRWPISSERHEGETDAELRERILDAFGHGSDK